MYLKKYIYLKRSLNCIKPCVIFLNIGKISRVLNMLYNCVIRYFWLVIKIKQMKPLPKGKQKNNAVGGQTKDKKKRDSQTFSLLAIQN